MLTARENQSDRFQEPNRRPWQYAAEKQATQMWDLRYALMEIFHVSFLREKKVSKDESESVCIFKKLQEREESSYNRGRLMFGPIR